MLGKVVLRKHGRALKAILVSAAFLLILRAQLLITGKTVLPVESPKTPISADAQPPVEPPAAVAESFGAPAHIWIPSIAVDAIVEHVAMKKDGSMDTPTHPLDVGWYSLGPRPGEPGSAAIAGHVDWWKGATAVFKDLRKVNIGDVITVQDEEGKEVSFIVRESRSYKAADDAREVFVSTDGKAHLNLITCDGAWDKNAGQYARRLVVFADKLDAP
jgi:sortase (surface protein transpeptidase)